MLPPQERAIHVIPFGYVRATTAAHAAEALATGGTALGGGTDLLVWLQEGLGSSTELVDLRSMPEVTGITQDDDGLRIGAACRIARLAEHPAVVEAYPALAQACESVGTPALRAMGTLGGNLCQRPRCWYYRRAIPCLKNGGSDCPAAVGENQYHAILEGGPCHIVHPSDPAVALAALDARIEIVGSEGTARETPIADFYLLPRERIDHETILGEGEFVSAVRIPRASAGGVQRYAKLMQRGAWDFALVSLASVKRPDGEVRLVLGGVAPRPWRVPVSVEEDVASGGLDEDAAEALAARALHDARPLSRNGYKITLAQTLLRRAMLELAST